jgi:Xaa-Pro aminopeptidase
MDALIHRAGDVRTSMSILAESAARSIAPSLPELVDSSDRRLDIDQKQERIAALLQEVGCEGLLLLEPENFSWLTSGAAQRGTLSPGDLPVLYANAEGRWVICSNVDSQRLFDEEVDGLGFQLKEWPWHWGREQLLADLCHDRKIASDQTFGDAKVVTDKIRRLRQALTPYEQACCDALGATVSHALEATCRTMEQRETEREIAGQLSHRLLHRGATPVVIQVAGEDRSRRYRQCGYTSLPIQRYCVMLATARKYGLCVTASRAVSFGKPEPAFDKEHDAACKISATYIASTWPDAVPRQILNTGRQIFKLIGYEHEWRLAPQGYATGRAAVEMPFSPTTDDLLQAGWAVTWHGSVGAGISTDTFIVTESGPHLVTTPEAWPLKRIRVQGNEFFRPDLFIR